MASNSLKGFALRVVIWLPVVFAGWFHLSILLTRPLRWLAQLTLGGLWPTLFSEVEQNGYLLLVVTALAAPSEAARGQLAEMVIEVNPLIYGYSWPLFTALVLGLPGGERERWWRWALGMGILLLGQLVGVSCEVLRTAVIELGGLSDPVVHFESWGRELVVLGYQFGSVILPPVAPAVLWLVLYRDFVELLVTGANNQEPDPGGESSER